MKQEISAAYCFICRATTEHIVREKDGAIVSMFCRRHKGSVQSF